MLATIWTTVLQRPYVFMFLIAYLVLGRIYFGTWRKTLIWLVVGYVVAWASEVSSIHNGFPYGLYYYRYENMPGELMVAGVPFWDSLSYPFMIFAGWTTARFILGSKAFGIWAAVFGAFLTMLLDIIIDPLTVLGDKWFLGNIYYYPNGGQYFGVPFTNFAGWFLVPLAVILIFSVIARHLEPKQSPVQEIASPLSEARNDIRLRHFLNPLFYLSIALFNLIITVKIGENLIFATDCLLLIPIVWLLMWRTKRLGFKA